MWEEKKTESRQLYCCVFSPCFLLPSHLYSTSLKVIWKKTPGLCNNHCQSHEFSRITFICHNWLPEGGSLSSTYITPLVSFLWVSLSTQKWQAPHKVGCCTKWWVLYVIQSNIVSNALSDSHFSWECRGLRWRVIPKRTLYLGLITIQNKWVFLQWETMSKWKGRGILS